MKTCTLCESEYDKFLEAKRNRYDYGFCSIYCMTEHKEPCVGCGQKIVYNDREKINKFFKRKFCSQKCSAKYISHKEKSSETRAKIAAAANARVGQPGYLEKKKDSWMKFRNSDRYKESKEKSSKRYREWRKGNPEEVRKMIEKQKETRIAMGSNKKISQKRIAFFKTKAGEELKKKYSSLYSGTTRPPHVTQKMKDAVRVFWDSEAGWNLRNKLSEMRTDGLRDDVPFGPGWNHQASVIRARDCHTCQVCALTSEDIRELLSVHHIYSRRMYGYIPGQNENYRWANHQANLVALCRSCHMAVEMGSKSLPTAIQSRADELWELFIQR